ncbi:MAG: fatty acid desaturase family protein [Phycisphaerales bacterium JB040]
MDRNGPQPDPHHHPQHHWLALNALMHLGAIAGAIWLWPTPYWPAVVPCWIVAAWMNHAALTMLHEAAHASLWKSKPLNELHGVLIGTLALIPLSVYRYVHARHHAHLGRERDPEFWPYNLTSAPRALRIAYAWAELALGFLLTPLLYSVRTAFSWKSVPARHRPRLLMEWAVILVVWPAAIAAILSLGWLELFVVGWLVPAWIAGTAQTVRKFTEHLGMHGDTILTMTRTVAYTKPLGQAASRTQRHVDHHATHHQRARIPFYNLPEATRHAYGREPEARLYHSHAEAVLDMLPHLLNPKVGPQWSTRSKPPQPTTN